MRNTAVIHMVSGSVVTVTTEGNALDLHGEDRDWFFRLCDLINEYRAKYPEAVAAEVS